MAKKKKKSAKRPAVAQVRPAAIQACAPVTARPPSETAAAACDPLSAPEPPRTRVAPGRFFGAVTGSGRALAFFLLAFFLIALMESERVGHYLDGWAPNVAAETTAAAVHGLADASGLSWLTARERELVRHYTDFRIIGEKRVEGAVAEGPTPSSAGKGETVRPGPGGASGAGQTARVLETPERVYVRTARVLADEIMDRQSLLDMERRAFQGIGGSVGTVAPPAGLPVPGASFRQGTPLSSARRLVATSRPVSTVAPGASKSGFGWNGERAAIDWYGATPAASAALSGQDQDAAKAAARDSREAIDALGPTTVVTLSTPSSALDRDHSLPGKEIGSLTIETDGEGKRVLMVGDSMMGWGLGHVLERNLSKIPGIKVKRDTRPSTGLSRDDFFDWPKHLNELVDAYNPDLVVVCIGANDGQNILDPSRKRHVVGTSSWETTYQQRAEEFIRIAQSKGAQVLWLGLPIVGVEPAGKVLRQLSLLQQAACSHLGSAEFLDNYLVLADNNGLYTTFAEGKDKKQIRIRHKDKIHVTTEGGSILAEYALPAILKLLSRSAPLTPAR